MTGVVSPTADRGRLGPYRSGRASSCVRWCTSRAGLAVGKRSEGLASFGGITEIMKEIIGRCLGL